MEFLTLHQRHPTTHARLMRSMHKLVAIVTMVMTVMQAAGVDGSTAVFSVPTAHAATGIFAPINYQGKISAINGTAVADGKYNMRFKIFDAATGGNKLWEETWNGSTQQVTMTGGLFSVALGSQVAMTGSVNFNSDNLYLQVEFDPSNNGTYPEVFSPRRRFGSVPYAHNADTLDGLDSRQFARTDIAQVMSGTLTIKPNDLTKIGLDIVSTAASSTTPGLRISTQGAPAIVFGSGGANYDVNLYRFGANILKTDDSMYVGAALSGSVVHAEKSLTTSGTLVFEGAASGSSLYLGTSLKGAGLTSCNSTNSALQWNSTTGRFSCGTITQGTSFSTGQVITIGDARYVRKSGDTMTGALNIRPTVGVNSVGLNVAAVMSGRSLVIEGTGSSPLLYTDLTHGRLGIGTTSPQKQLEIDGVEAGLLVNATVGTARLIFKNAGVEHAQITEGITGLPRDLSITNAGGNELLTVNTDSGRVAIGSGHVLAKATLDVLGTISGSIIYGTNAVNSSGSITAEGTISGANLYIGNSIKGAGLASCNSTNNALQWNSSTGRFSCGSVSGTTNSGNVIAIGDARYVKKSGDTMTGALNIRPTAGVGIVGLNVGATMSGRELVVEGTGANPLIYTAGGDVGIGTSKPGAFFNIVSRNTTLDPDILFQKDSGFLLYTSDVYSSVNATQSPQWITRRARGTSASPASVQVGDQLGLFGFRAYSGTGFVQRAYLNAIVDQAIGNGKAPTALTFATSPDQNQPVERMRITSSGSIGIGTASPGSRLSVSGAVIIGNNIGSAAADANVGLEVISTISGSTVYATNALRSSGSIVAEGTISGANLFVGTSIKGAGLSNCNSTNNALQWNSTTGRFSCGTITVGTSFSTGQVITIGDGRYVKKSGDTMTGALTINVTNGSLGTIGLKVINTLSGAIIHAEKQLTSSGMIVGKQSGTSVGSGVLTIANTTRYGTGAYIFASGSALALDSNHNNAHVAPNILFGYKGNFDTNLYRFAASILKTDGSLYATNTLSGAIVHADNSLTSSGTLTIKGIARFQNNVNVVGTVSGSTIYAINSLRSSGSIVAEGTISGANLFIGTSIKGAGLTSCNSTNNALQWNSSTGRFSCGTISVGTSFSTGQVITIGDGRYVKKSGDTMTGALTINVTNGSLGTIGLKVINTLSGAIIHAEKNLTSSGSIVAKKDITAYGTVLTRYGVQLLSGALITELSGFNDSVDLEANLTTHGVTRLTENGNLVNIGSIQAGDALFTMGGTFASKVDYTAGSSTHSVAIGDLNGDGIADVVTANYTSGTVSVYLNNGTGALASKVDYTTGSNPFSVAIGDVNGDGKPDLAVANSSSNTVSVFLNKGNGTFAGKVDYTTGTDPVSVAIGDLNGDGKADLAVANSGSGFGTTVSVFLNNGDGTFAGKVDYTTGTNPSAVAIGDVNGDGKPDLAVANVASTTVSVLMNKGNGTFATKVDYTTGTNPKGVAIGDLNGDNKPDLAVTNYSDATVSVFLNNGDGTFATKVDYTTGTNPRDVAIGDLNGDGKADLAVSNYGSDTASVFLNNGHGTFAGKVDYTTGSGPWSIAIGDLNRDGKADLAVANMNTNNVSILLNNAKTILTASSGTGGAVGIGTSNPGAKLAVSGSVIIGSNIGHATTDTGVNLEVAGTISGSTIFANSALRSSGSIVAEGTISGANLFVGTSLKGAGLSICNSANSFLQWNSSTGRFGCGTASGGTGTGNVVAIGDARYVKKSGDTMTGALTINVTNGTLGTIGLKVINTLSGAVVHAEKALTSSGTLVFEGAASGSSLYLGTSLKGAGLTSCNSTNSALQWNSTTGRFSCGTITVGTSFSSGQVITIGDARYVKKSGDTMTGALNIRPTLGASTVGLNVAATMSGRALVIEGTGSVPLITTQQQYGTIVMGTGAYRTLTGAAIMEPQLNIRGRASAARVGSGSTGTSPYDVAVAGRYAYVVNNTSNTLQVFDISNPAHPTSVGSVSTDSSPANIVVQGKFAYVGLGGSTDLQIFDISNPSAPFKVGSYANSSVSTRDVAVQGQYVYLLDSSKIYVIDTSIASAPIVVGSASLTNSNGRRIVTQGKYAYVTIGTTTNAVQIFNMSDPTNPVSVGTVTTGSNPQGLSVEGRYAYVTNFASNTLGIYDISNPSSPSAVSTVSTSASPIDVKVQDRMAYVIAGSTLDFIDISNPLAPYKIGSASLAAGSSPQFFAVNGRYAYVPDYGSKSLSIFDLGGAYVQALEAGSVHVSSLDVTENIHGMNLSLGGSSMIAGSLVVTGNAAFGSGDLVNIGSSTGNTLVVRGTTSGSIVHAEKALTSSGTLVFEGAASGSSLYLGTSLQGAGLTDCSNSVSSKLLWNSATGRFSCGTDQSGSSGISQAVADQRYVKKSGDTMTGALTINVTGGNVSTIGLKVINTLSGAIIHAEKTLASSGTLVFEGAASGSSLYLGTSLQGAGLTNCNSAANALQWNSTTGRFSCGTITGGTSFSSGQVIAIGDARYVKKSGDTMTGALNIRPTVGSTTVGLNVAATMSGRSLVIEGTGATPLLSSDLSHGRLGIGTTTPGSALEINGDLTFTKDGQAGVLPTMRIISVPNQTSGSIQGNTLQINAGGSANALGSAGGGSLYLLAGDSLSQTGVGGALVIAGGDSHGTGNAGNVYIYGGHNTASNTGNGNVILAYSGSATTGNVGIGLNTPKSKLAVSGSVIIGNNLGSAAADANVGLEVIGTVSGSTIYATNALRSSGSIVAEGTISGANLYVGTSIKGAGLTSCNSTNNALQWNSTTGRFSCGTITGGGTSFSSGQVLTLGDARYVKKSGDTMTGALTINVTGGTNGTIGLKVLNTLSGAIIHAEKTLTSSGSIIAKNDVTAYGTVLTRYGVQMMSGALITELSGFNDSINLEANLAIHGLTRITTQGNLVNIGSIQGGAAILTAGGTFASKVDYTAGVSPISAAAGDLNGDGKPDIAVANYTSGTVSVFLNNGSGTFASKVDYTAGTNPFAVAVGDLNGDGKADIAVVDYSSATVSVFLNKGNGTFASKVDYTTGSNPYSVAIGDLNGDGKADLAVTNHTSNTVSVLLNNGNGTFASKVDYTTGSQPHSVAIGDVNGDGKADLAVANQGSSTVSVFLNKGNGTFATKVDYTADTFPNGVAIGDLNGDGKADIAAINYTSSTLSVFRNTGTGSFAPKVDYTTGSNPFSVAIGDLNGDGKADLAVANYGASTTSVFLNNGDGTFAAKTDYTTGSSPHTVVISDFNGDSKNDLATANYGSSSISVLMNIASQTVSTFSNSGALAVVNKTRTGTGIYAFSSGSAVLALQAGTQSGSKTPDILFGYKGNFDTKITRTGTGALTFNSSTGVLLTLNTGMTNAKQDVFRIISQVNNGKGTLPDNLVFRVNASGAVFSDAAYHSYGADYAEWFYDGNQNLQPGEIVCIDVTRNNAVKRCTRDGDSDVMGVVSTNPAFIGNTITGAEGLMPPGYVLVGLIGQVPTKVMVTGTGTIHPGDQLTAASTPGYARKALPGESTLGVALESIDHGTGTINVLISRRNSSMTVDTVSQKVLDTIASMKIGDEVQTMVAGAVQNLNVNDQVDSEVQKQLSAIQATNADIKTLQSEIDDLKSKLATMTSQSGSTTTIINNTTQTGAKLSADISAQTMTLEKTLMVGGDTHIGGDLHLDGALVASDILVPGGIAIDGGETVNGDLAATTLHVNSGAEVDGALTINGNLRINSGSLLFGSGALQLSDLVVQKALVVLGNITINGLATFLGDVSIKGELSVSNRQAGFAIIPRTGTAVTVLFGSGGLRGTPVVTASPDAPVLYAVNKTTQTGFTIQLATPAVTDIKFSWLALTTDMPGTQTGSVVADSSTVFPLASDNIPVSSDMVWNACIRGIAMFDASGKALSCSRYHDSYTWHQPDLKIDFLWNTDLTPPLLVVPDGYTTQVTEDAASLRAAITGGGNDGTDEASAASTSSTSDATATSSESSQSSDSSDSSLAIEPVTTDPATAATSSTSSADSASSDTSVTSNTTSSVASISSVTSAPSVPSATSSAPSTAATDAASSTATTTDMMTTSSAPAATDTTPSSTAPAVTGTDAATQTQ